jgi:hypothetical protein
MNDTYSYRWYIQQFEQAKNVSEEFILSVDKTQFLQPPAKGKWSIAECYSHLINYGDLYLQYMEPAMTNAIITTDHPDRPFQPRWIARKVISFFDPPYKIKVKTIKAMKPDPVSGYDRMELLDEYINLQDRLIALLEKGYHRHINLNAAKAKHPVFHFITMTLSECFAIAEVHQRRHQWQAEQTLEALKMNTTV